MKTGKLLQLTWRLAVCAAVVAAFVIWFARELAPSVPLLAVFGWVIAGAALVGGAIIAVIVLQGSFNQWTFRKGGLDPQWLWFREDPPGTAQLRELRREER
jgi:hypothetical protein